MFLRTKFKEGDPVTTKRGSQGVVTAIIRRYGNTIYEIDNSFEEVGGNLKHSQIFEKSKGNPDDVEEKFKKILSDEMLSYMKKKDMNKKELSEHLGVSSTSFINDIVNRKQQLSLHTFNKLLLAIGRKATIVLDQN